MSSHAYVVLCLDTTTGAIRNGGGIGVFSEPEPTVSYGYRTFVLIERDGATFEHALHAACREFWTSPAYTWAHRFANDYLKREQRHA